MNVKQSDHATRFAKFLIPLLIALLGLAPSHIVLAGEFTLTGLGTLGGIWSWANATNSHGDVVGYADAPDGAYHPFLYSNGVLTDLATIGGTVGQATGINDSGQIAVTNTSTSHAGLYANGVTTDLNNLLGGAISWTTGINNSGAIVGSYATSLGATNLSFIYSDGQMLLSAALLGDIPVWALDINDQSQVVGVLQYPFQSARATLFDLLTGTITDLGSLGGPSSWASAISNNGYVVGSADTSLFSTHAFLWNNGVIADLGALTDWSMAFGVNSHGYVVGDSGTSAFLYANGMMVDLNSLLPAGSGWTLNNARAINDAGQIVGTGTHDGHDEAYLLSSPALYIQPQAPQLNHEGESVSRKVFAIDQNAEVMQFRARGLPAGLSINRNTGVIGGMIATGAAGKYNVMVLVGDQTNVASTRFRWTVKP